VKSNWRTVLAATLTNASSYSSGPLDVGDLEKLLMTVHTLSASPNTDTYDFIVKAIDAYGNLYNVGSVRAHSLGDAALVAGGTSIGAEFGSQLFGDQILVDLQMTSGDTISAQLSIKGK